MKEVKTRIKYPVDLNTRQGFAWENKRVTVRYGTSRGRDTYGYTTCTLSVAGKGRRGHCSGGGYSLIGTVIGEWLERDFSEQLKMLNFGKLRKIGYELCGIRFIDQNTGKSVNQWKDGCTISINGIVGDSCMKEILQCLGYCLEYVGETSSVKHYVLNAYPKSFMEVVRYVDENNIPENKEA